jgi:hypothetical protein
VSPSSRLPSPTTLASDADRTACEQALRRAYADGRFDHHELEERLDLVWRARTTGDLRRARRGLPKDLAVRPKPGTLKKVHRAALGLHATAYAGGNGAAIGLWALTGEGLFWPAVLLVPTTGLLAAHAAAGPVVRRAWSRRRGPRGR